MHRIDLLYNFSEEFRFRFDLVDFLKKLACTSNRITNASFCTVALYDPVTDELYYFMSCNYDKSFNPEIKEDFSRTKNGEGIIGWAAAHKTTLNLINPCNDKRYSKLVDEKLYKGDKSILAVPMICRNKLIGAIELFNKQDKTGFSKSDEKSVSRDKNRISIELIHPLFTLSGAVFQAHPDLHGVRCVLLVYIPKKSVRNSHPILA